MPGIGEQHLQQPQLELGETHRLGVGDAHGVLARDRAPTRPAASGAAGLHPGAAQQRPDAREQRARAEGLGEVVVGAEAERAHQVLLLAAHRQHHDRHARARADRLAHLEARQRRHVDIEHHQVRGFLLEAAVAARRPSAALITRYPAWASVKAMSSRRSASSSATSTFMRPLSVGQGEAEAGAAGRGALEGDAAAVTVDDRLHQPQAETETCRLGLAAAAPEAREQLRVLAGGGTLRPHPRPRRAPPRRALRRRCAPRCPRERTCWHWRAG